MSPQVPRIPSPADLARRQVPRPPARPPQSRRSAEAERERALRAQTADPATNFAALDADEFFAVLRCACQEGLGNPALIAEAARRLGDGTVTSRDLHQVLFVAGGGEEWADARGAAMTIAAQRPHLAVEVVNLEVQRSGTSPIRVTESAGEGFFTATASLERDGVTVAGQPRRDTSKKRAGQRAVVSLLSALAGIPEPAATDPAGVPDRRTEVMTPLAAPTAPGPAPAAISPAELESWLDHVVGLPEPDPALANQLTAGRLTTRASYLLLFEAHPQGWAGPRATAWQALAATPTQAPGVLSLVTQARSWPPARYVDPGEHAVAAYVSTSDGLVVGEPALGPGIRAARSAAALALIRDLAPALDGDSVPEVPAAGDNPVGVLNERAQIGAITDLTYAQESAGAAHQPVFTCTASCVHATDQYVGRAEAPTKNAAKAAAAADLLAQVLAAERSRLARLAHARREQARSPEGIFARLLRAGCPVEFTGWGFRLGGEAPEPMAAHELPVLSALPVLTTVEDQAHPTALAWASAARAALEAVVARRVYPAVDAEGWDCWRLSLAEPPDPAVARFLDVIAVARFLDVVADALLRPPGARLVVGDLPYAGRARPLGARAVEWADLAADAAEGTTAAPLVIRLAPPDGDDLPLRAQLRPAIGLGADPEGFSPAQERLLRRAARQWPPLTRVMREATLSGTEAAELLGPEGTQLAELGITTEWPADLVSASGLGTAIVAAQPTGGSGGFAPTDVVDLTWQLHLDGKPLTEQETAAAAAAVAGVIRIRGRWVVVDAATQRLARQRDAGHLTGALALTAALTGQVTVDGRSVDCSAAGRLAELVAALRGSDDVSEPSDWRPPEGLTASLRGYQQIGVRWLERTASLGFGALLADDMGLGKTLTVIAYRLVRGGTGPSLVVCPASLVGNWEREFAKFAPGSTVRRYHAASRSLAALAPGEVVVTTYGTLLRDAQPLAAVPWDLVVADEAQQVKNHRSQAARALRLLRPAARIAVTGTPVENSVSELWAILDWTNPGLFGPLASFRERFGRAAEPEAAGQLRRLVAPFVLRRRKTDPDVAPELPDKVINDRYVELSREQAALYQAVTERALDQISDSDGPRRRGEVLRLLQSLRQICNSPAHYLRESPDGWDAPAQAARSGKLQVLEELMESVVLSDSAALIFTGYVVMGNLIRAHLAACGIRAEFLHGGVPVADRPAIVDRFQSGDGDALILSVRAAGTGLNLTRAGHVIHFDRPWNPAVEDQATDRAHRIGQHRLVEVHHLIAEGTVEDRIAQLLASKRELTEAILPRAATTLTDLSDSELSTLVSLSADPRTGGAV